MMKSYIDQIGRKLELEYLPKRIVSLVPSQTEYFYALGMEERIVGITKFCIHPKAWFKTKERVGCKRC
jgi:ABC-type hemin transport system substrate-binding protein